MNIVDPVIRLSRWRLILSEFDFEVKYIKGTQNHVADATSRLPTYAYVTPDPELEIPTFLAEGDYVLNQYPVISKFDTSSWTKCDWDPYELHKDERILQFSNVIAALAVDVHQEVSAITLGE